MEPGMFGKVTSGWEAIVLWRSDAASCLTGQTAYRNNKIQSMQTFIPREEKAHPANAPAAPAAVFTSFA